MEGVLPSGCPLLPNYMSLLRMMSFLKLKDYVHKLSQEEKVQDQSVISFDILIQNEATAHKQG
jgi:hypothetical protein